MLRDKISRIELSLIEIFSILTFIGLGYCLIYKYTFYQKLGIPGFITNLTPQFLFLTSLKLLFIGIFSIIIGILYGYIISKIMKVFPPLRLSSHNISIPTIGTILVFLIPYLIFENKIPEYLMDFKTSDIFYSYFISICTSLVVMNFNLYLDIKRNSLTPKADFKFKIELSIILAFTVGLIYFYQPYYFGSKEAKNILYRKEETLNKILLKDTIKDWYLIESMGEKLIIIDKKNNIKIIEYKDLDFIKTERKLHN
ncbi:hypothetical protein JDA50_19760 [Acinetobacter pittii]|uniref:Uncharacterized protein n=1 Tax=Acinetobacter pittii TaxID=48296 RepID=A0A8I1H8K9_ACIPI|nr:hypothetical protein [Acinetobacter pittii]MBK1446632.1 hypothetical protein [Acinetobacter pittii]MCJ9040941.1 hypothetical protein [Acinetobacter pittii]HEE6562263.1 hypothetical protein [Acinetobacter baumannii]